MCSYLDDESIECRPTQNRVAITTWKCTVCRETGLTDTTVLTSPVFLLIRPCLRTEKKRKRQGYGHLPHKDFVSVVIPEASSASKLQFTHRALAITGWLHLLGLLSPVLIFPFLEFLAHTHRGCPNRITMDELLLSGLHKNCCCRTF